MLRACKRARAGEEKKNEGLKHQRMPEVCVPQATVTSKNHRFDFVLWKYLDV